MLSTLKLSCATGFRRLDKRFLISALILLSCSGSFIISGCTYTTQAQIADEHSEMPAAENPAKPRAVISDEKPVRVPMKSE